MRFPNLTLFIAACLQGCASASDDASTSPERPPKEPTAQDDDPFAPNEVWRDSCRLWCGANQVLEGDCVKGEAVLRGARLGSEPFPEEPPKSYDIACIDRCLAVRPPSSRCWQQQAEANDCYARTAVFICVEAGVWDPYGCENAGEDLALCGESD